MSEPVSTNSPTEEDGRHIWPTVAGFALTRLVGNLFIRGPYVFITEISKGLGVSVETMTLVLGVRELGGLGSPIAGRLVDRGHGPAVIIAGGALTGAACLGATPGWFPLFVVAMVLGGMTKNWVDLSQNAWVGHRVPVAKRARVIGFIETTWAGSFLLGVPLVGFVVDRWGWRAGFWLIGPLFVALAVTSGLRLATGSHSPDEFAHTGSDEAAPVAMDATPAVAHVGNPARFKVAMWAFFVLQSLGQMSVFAVNGDWFVEDLGMSNTGLSIATAVLGVAELAGVVWVMAFADRLGKARVARIALGVAALPSIVLILWSGNVAWGVAMIVIMDFAIEIAFVSALPLASELDPTNRGKAVGQVFVLMMGSRALASAVAGSIYANVGFDASLALSATACLTGFAAMDWARRGSEVPTP